MTPGSSGRMEPRCIVRRAAARRLPIHRRFRARSQVAQQISVGERTECAITSDGALICSNSDAPSGVFTEVATGDRAACAIDVNHTLSCWGDDALGKVTPPSGSYEQVSMSNAHACALTTAKSVVCWGNNTAGQSSPPSGDFQQVTAGNLHTCGLRPGARLNAGQQRQRWRDATGGNVHGGQRGL